MKLRRKTVNQKTYIDLNPGVLFVFINVPDFMKDQDECVCEKLEGHGFMLHDGSGRSSMIYTNKYVTILAPEDVEIVNSE